MPRTPKSSIFARWIFPITYSKTDFLRRRQGDLAYGRVLTACHTVGARFVYWCQDFYSVAAGRLLARRLPGIGHAVGAWYRRLERRQMQGADHVVHITDDFLAQTDHWAVPVTRLA